MLRKRARALHDLIVHAIFHLQCWVYFLSMEVIFLCVLCLLFFFEVIYQFLNGGVFS